MQNNYGNSEINKNLNQSHIANVNKSSAFHTAQPCKTSIGTKILFETPSKVNVQNPNQNIRKHSIEKLSQPQSIYENFNFNFNTNIISGDKTLPVRKSRLFNRSMETDKKKLKTEMKRDLSMPPISGGPMSVVENNIYSQYSMEQNNIKYSIDTDLNNDTNNYDDTSSYMYDSIITNVSITPPPVHMVSTTSAEYANRKAIIRPLAFRPVQQQSEWIQSNSDPSPTKPPVSIKTKIPPQKRISPPPVPPHASRVINKSNLTRVQSAKSGDSSGYYSSRATGTLTGTASSTDISPTFDESISINDNYQIGDIYNNTIELIQSNTDQSECRQSDQNDIAKTDKIKFSMDSEIISERQRNKRLETSLTNSNCKLLEAENYIVELKKRLSQRAGELNQAMENLESVNRNLDYQNQKSMHLEKTIQSLKMIANERNRDYETKNQSTQTLPSNNDLATTKMLEHFDEERKVWLSEKCKVLTYQRQIETNFQQLLIKCRRLESHVLLMKTQLKDCRLRPSLSANHSEEHDKTSSHSADSSNRSYFTNISRIEVTEHQSSF